MKKKPPLISLLSSIGNKFGKSAAIGLNDDFVDAIQTHFDGAIPTVTDIYYSILNRYPELEAARASYSDWQDVAVRIYEAFSSDEAYCNFLNLLCREYPLIPRTTFIHIAKTAGSFVRETFSIQPGGLLWDAAYEVISSTRRPLIDDLIRLSNGQVRKVFVTGHYTLPTLIGRGTLSPFNRVFTTLREPSEIIVSALNYYLMELYSNADSPLCSVVRNILARRFSLANGPDESLALEYANDLLFSEEFGSEFRHPITRYLGTSLMNALENCEIYRLEFVGIDSIADYLRAECGVKKFPKETRINESVKYVNGINELSSHGRAYVFDDLCQGDSGFYQWILSAIKKSDKGWTLLP